MIFLALAHASCLQQSHQYVSNATHQYDKPRLATGYSSDDHWDIIPDTDQQNHVARPGLPPSHPSGLSALTAPSPLPTPGSLSSITPFNLGMPPALPQAKPQQPKDRDRDPQTVRKKAPNESKGFTAAGILRALDPHNHSVSAEAHEPSEDGVSLTEHSSREEKKERRNFWERASGKDRARESDRDREDENQPVFKQISQVAEGPFKADRGALLSIGCGRVLFDTIHRRHDAVQALNHTMAFLDMIQSGDA